MEFTYPLNMRFECNGCGVCCGDTKEKTRHILLLTSEANQIAKETLKAIADFAVEIEGKQPYRYEMRKINEKCVFLKNSKCDIYSLRPLICNFYPFQLTFNEGSKKYEFDFTLECPGLDSGKVLAEVDFKRLFQLAKERLPSYY